MPFLKDFTKILHEKLLEQNLNLPGFFTEMFAKALLRKISNIKSVLKKAQTQTLMFLYYLEMGYYGNVRRVEN